MTNIVQPTSALLPSPSMQTPSTSNKRRRLSQTPQSVSAISSPSSSTCDDEGEDGSIASTSTPPTRTRKTNKASAEKDPIRAARLEARAARNRISAQHSRDKKKTHVQTLEAEVTQLRSEKALLAERVENLENLVKTLIAAASPSASDGGIAPQTTILSPSTAVIDPVTVVTPVSLDLLPSRPFSVSSLDASSLAAPIDLPSVSVPNPSLSSSLLSTGTLLQDSSIEAATPNFDESPSREEKRGKGEGQEQQKQSSIDSINGSSSGAIIDVDWATKGQRCEQKEGIEIDDDDAKGRRVGEDDGVWLAQYLESMVAQPTEGGEEEITHLYSGTSSAQGEAAKRQDQQEEYLSVASTPSDEFDLDSLLAVDQLVEVEMEMEANEGFGTIFDMMRSQSGPDVISV